MSSKRKIHPADTYILDDDVMDEMENFDSTAILDDTQVRVEDTRTLDDELLDDIESRTVVLDNLPSHKKA